MSKNVLNTYNFVSTSNRQRPLSSDHYRLIIRQQPKIARLCSSKERDRRPVDPPPIIQLKVEGSSEEAQNFLQSPYYFMCANLMHHSGNSDLAISSQCLAGTVVSSLHKLKDIDNTDGGFFVFGDISVRVEGRYRLRFSLFEIIRDEVVHIQSLMSDVFTVYPPKTFPGMSESTFLSRSFSDQGVRIRIRKEHRIQMKRPPSSRHSDIADGEDNIHDDGLDLGDTLRRKRSRCSSSPPMELQSTGSPYHQQSPPLPNNDRNSNTSSYSYSSPNVNHQYESSSSFSPSHCEPVLRQRSLDRESTYQHYDSERESLHDDRTSVRSDSYDVTSSPYGDPECRRSSKPEFLFSSDDPRSTNQSNNYSRPLRPLHHKPQRGTTLPPLLEYPDSSSRHQIYDSLDSNANYQATNRSPLQPPSNSSSHYSSGPRLYQVKTPTRSNTLPSYIDSRSQPHHYRTMNSEQPLSSVNQLPTPRTSFDAHLTHLSRTSPNISTSPDGYKDSYSNNDSASNVNITTPRFTKQFTSSPRPSHSQLSSSPPLPTDNTRATSGSTSMSIVSGHPPTPARLLTTPLHPTTTTTRLPPITALTDNLGMDGFSRRKELPMPFSSPPTLVINDNSGGDTNHFQSDRLLPRQHYQHYHNTNASSSMIQDHVQNYSHFTERPVLNNNILAPPTFAQDSVRSWNGGYLT
ncbi:8816_t:CDS:2 [Acaulospora morrowiae]|uniref:8816_t:CDS:1 n=1 Tax=Acaulospora morrowiae TaxID=94023 RepID=A0A9N9AG69_9GLOM|nr:8816_t:CDS:2 [Acaulospora morrowiae]